MRNEQPIKRMEDWSKFEWPAENYDYKKDGRLIWTDEIYNVIDAIYQNKIDGILPHVPDKLFKAMISDYCHDIDAGLFFENEDLLIQEFKRRKISLDEVKEILPDTDILEKERKQFIDKYKNN